MKLHKLLVLFFLGIVVLTFACKKSEKQAQSPLTKDTAMAALDGIKSISPQLGQINFEFDKIEQSEIPNLYQARFYVQQQDNVIPVVIYITSDGKYAILGQIINIQTKQNITNAFGGEVKHLPVDLSKINIRNAAYKGNLDAPVQIIEYSDFQCPFCKRAAATVHQIIQNYGKDVVVIFKHLPLPMHNLAKNMAIAAECAADQNPEAFWKFHDTFFSETFSAADEIALKDAVIKIAKDANLNIAAFTDCYNNNKTAERVEAHYNEAMSIGVNSTPTFIINGQKVAGALPYENFKQIIDEKLATK
jgi:protein-disulfide isomerase